MFDTLESYLLNQYNLLRTDDFWVNNGEIFIFRRNPLSYFGSVTVTNGIRVEAQAHLVHQFCRFDKERFDDAPKYYFVYQHRITVDADNGPRDFKPC